MRRVACLLIVVFSCIGSVRAGADATERFEARTFKGSAELPYRLLKPKDFDAKKNYPLVLFFHGAGERGTDNVAQLKHGVKTFASDEYLKAYPCFVIAPQCPAKEQWVNTPWGAPEHTMPEQPSKSMAAAFELLDAIRNEFPIDPTRIYVTGISMGGFGTWDALQRHPEIFAAGVPICGGGDKALAPRMAKMPLWIFHGGNDGVVKTKRAQDMVAALKAAGGQPKYEEYPGVGHDSWTRAYATNELYKWLFAQRRTEPAPPPKKCSATTSPAAEPTQMPFQPGKGNAIIFAPTDAKFVRLTVSDPNSGDAPGLDEVEVYAQTGTNNLALASAGGKATASSCLSGYAIHKVEHLNDGKYGNDHSWIAGEKAGWVQIELAQPASVSRVVVSRDRAGAFQDRMPTAIRVEVSGDGSAWRQVASVKSPAPPSKMPPPSAPVANFAEAVKWLEAEAHRVIRASAVPMKDGTMAFPPQVGIGYDAFWLRDYEYALEGSIQSFSDEELTAACRVFIKAIRDDGAAVDCVRFAGIPIYKPGYGSMGREPVLDGPPFTVSVAWQTFRRTKDKALLREILDPLVKTMNYMPRNPTDGLAHIKVSGERCPYGFTDSIPKSGDELFCSLLLVQASRHLADLLEAAGRAGEAPKWREEAESISASVRRVFWDEQVGLFRATTGACNVPDIWGSAFAVWLGVATKEQAQRTATYFKDHYDELVLHGQVRHMPGFMDWNGRKSATNSGQYQSGGFWATPVGWFVFTLDLADQALADKTVVDMVRHFQTHGACEWINREGKCQLPGYTASAALPLDGIRALQARRQTRR